MIIAKNYPNRGLMLPSIPLGCTKVPNNKGFWNQKESLHLSMSAHVKVSCDQAHSNWPHLILM